jgi:hypothetical protein
MEMRQQGFISLYRSTIMVSALDETDFSKAVARLREVSRRDSCIDRYTVPHTSVICTSKTGPASKEVGRAAVTSRSNVEEDHLNLRAYVSSPHHIWFLSSPTGNLVAHTVPKSASHTIWRWRYLELIPREAAASHPHAGVEYSTLRCHRV